MLTMVYFGVNLSIEDVNNVWVIKKVVEEEILKKNFVSLRQGLPM